MDRLPILFQALLLLQSHLDFFVMLMIVFVLKKLQDQVLGALDYSRMSRHLLVTAGDDGSIHLWDTTGRSPKVSTLTMGCILMRVLDFFK